jgi:UDP-N-acetylglucosamine acyltransferase
MSTSIHPTAVVDPKASIGQGVSIGPYAVIEGATQIGDGTSIDAFAHIKANTTLGSRNTIHSYACLGGPPQDVKFQGEDTLLTIGDENVIREYVTINRGTLDGRGETRIASHCMIMAYVHIAHDCYLGNEVIMANAATLAGHVTIEDKAVIGGLTAVHQFVRIGSYAYIGGMSGVAQDVPPYMLIAGERAWLHGLNLIGLKRQGFSPDQISALKKAYKLLWRSGLRRQEALDQARDELGDRPEVSDLLNFLDQSERGVIGPRSAAE